MNKLQMNESFIPVLGSREMTVLKSQLDLIEKNVVERIWKKDFTIWSEIPNEISNRLDWLDMPTAMTNEVDSINMFVDEIRKEGFENAVLLGMGGSSLAPEVFRLTFGVRTNYLDLEICDSTHPEFIKSKVEKYNPEKTLYIISTKSGGTIETISFMKYFYNQIKSKLGSEKAKKHFIAITDPGSGLQDMAIKLGFRKVFLNNPNIGGRFSALSKFGIVPAALLGINISNLLDRAAKLANESKNSKAENIDSNSSANLGLIFGEMANHNINKLTLLITEQLKSFGSWAEQLIAESTGKIGKGILPVDGEQIKDVTSLSIDRLFVFILLKGDSSFDAIISELKSHDLPFVKIVFNDIYDLGAEFFRWEFATAVAGWKMQLQPFDQPNVESAKIVARNLISQYKSSGKLPIVNSTLSENEIEFIGATDKKNIRDAVTDFVEKSKTEGSYICLQAFINPTEVSEKKLQQLRHVLLKKYSLPTTLGFGPRFLHSTGQLHKGDNGKGIFIQFVSEIQNDIPIPENAGDDESSFSFGILITAQTFGDRKALVDNNRNVITLKINNDVPKNLDLIKNYFE